MKRILALTLIAASVAATPALAQGVYLGPGGVGVDLGHRHYRDYDRDDYRFRRDEGRSVYRDRDVYRGDRFRDER